ncbi:MAG TPA: ThiF family adenylyltransferase [Myxococcales bacterium]|nr:ThiF family adenylyltransferase [Myxococcales bacterium]
MLSDAQQERYARHLLLDGFDQDRLFAAAVHVEGTEAAAHWAARYLAASGIGALQIDEPSWREELQQLGPWLHLRECAARIAPQGGPQQGAQAAIDFIRAL